ncbi:helicase associated domain (ha2) protein [Cardiosporidium cionae]|uniref:Helicase associated domain (Ha2) protein n=1 Tax=Cardiosporidium cionae TaxID=476202 RepID=A0ABQ7JDL1_9APIC|nr:helicase associated domain (ha2) protein [Cardiosporidium cionae]|eukprot:KAF8822088.1 helicase associated domain (ha2) protein [Cardiosporidium cionae]
MSATLNFCDFTENKTLFESPPPILRIEAKTYPVSVHFNRFTPRDYILEAKKKILQIHRKLPTGSILVFVSGKKEVHRLCALLENHSCSNPIAETPSPIPPLSTLEKNFPSSFSSSLENVTTSSEYDFSTVEPLVFSDSGVSFIEKNTGQKKSIHENIPDKDERLEGVEDAFSSDSELDETYDDFLDVAILKGSSMKMGEHLSVHTQEATARSSVSSAVETVDPSQLPLSALATVDSFVLPTSSLSPPSLLESIEGESISLTLNPGENLSSNRGVQNTITPLPTIVKVASQEEDNEDLLNASLSLRPSEAAKEGEEQHWKKDKAQSLWLGSDGRSSLVTLPLYASLSAQRQMATFVPPSAMQRVVIVATNVAETSVTLPNIRYVVDTGKEKTRRYVHSSGVSYFTVQWASKTSTEQRLGRCGRVGPGHCYRLYSSAVYNDLFPQFPPVAMAMAPLESVMLFISSLGIPRLMDFPFPTPPSKIAIQAACQRLYYLNAIFPRKGRNMGISILPHTATVCTMFGKVMSTLPITPRYAKMLLVAILRSEALSIPCIELACLLVAGLAVGELFGEEDKTHCSMQRDAKNVMAIIPKKEKTALKDYLRTIPFNGDIDAYLWACGAFVHATDPYSFCTENGMHFRQMNEMYSLAQQLARIISLKLRNIRLSLPLSLPPPTPAQVLCLQDCVLEGLVDHIAIRADCMEVTEAPRHAFLCADLQKGQFVYIHPSSFLYRQSPLPTAVAFNKIITTNHHFMFDCFAVDPVAISRLRSPLVKCDKFLSMPAPVYSPERDVVVGFVEPIYLPLEYRLPTREMDVPKSNSLRYFVFGRAFLEGHVFPNLNQFKSDLICDPSTLGISPNSQLSKFVKALQAKRCASRSSLREVWKTQPSYLLPEYVQLIRSSDYNFQKIQKLWPPH